MCLSVCVCAFPFEVPFKRLFAPLPEVGCPKFLAIRNPWGKVLERSGLRIVNFFFVSGLKSPRKQKFVVFADFAVQNMLRTTLPDG